MKKVKEALGSLVECASLLGLPKLDVNNSIEFINYNEFELSFEVVVQQLYEFDVEITVEVYRLIEKIAKLLNVSETEYNFMLTLINKDGNIPETLKSELLTLTKNVL